MKKLIKLTVVSLSLVLLSSLNTEKTFASNNMKIKVEGKEVKSDVAPFSVNGRTMVPVRFVSEALGAKVKWYPESQQISIEKPRKKQLSIDLKSPMRNSMNANHYETYGKGGFYGTGRYAVYLDVAPVVRNQRTFLPARIIAEELGYYVNWDAKTNTVNISKKYLGGQTYKQYLASQNTDPHEWSPLLKAQFEAEILERGFIDSIDQIIYEKTDPVNGEGGYTVNIMYEGKFTQVVGVNAKTGWYRR